MAIWSNWSDGQKWLMGIIATIVAGLITAGVGKLVFTSHAQPPTSKDCSTMAGYPVGRWSVRGVQVRGGKPDATFAREIFFDTRTSGTWFEGLGEQQPDGRYLIETAAPLTASESLGPGKKIVLTTKRKQNFTPTEEAVATPLDRVYRGQGVMTVSPDGCSMRGYSLGGPSSGDYAVIVDYCWDQSGSCAPLPVSEGWRAPLVASGSKDR